MGLKKNDELEVTIERYGDNGEGIAIADGMVIFVPFACVGERVLVHIIFDKKNFLVARPVKFISTSPSRVTPPCPNYSKCGGCDLQHICYEEQLKLKKKIVENSLKKYGKIDAVVLDTIPSPKTLRYRNKFAFPVGQGADGEVQIGMYRKNSHNIVEVEDCLLQSERAREIVRLFKEFMQENHISGYSEETKAGDIRHIVVREGKDSFLLTVVVTDKKFNNFSPLIEKLKTKFNSFGIIKNVNSSSSNVIFGNLDEKIYGIDEIELNEFSLSFKVGSRSFLQVNDEVKTKIYEQILSQISSSDIVVDAYSGAGLLSGIISKKARQVYGIEIVEQATKNAEILKKNNNLDNLINKNGDCGIVLPKLIEKLGSDITLILDPPRKGVDQPVIDCILKVKPRKLIYISCNPATLARDLEKLSGIYEPNFVQPYDMFPQTANVETLVSLSLKGEKTL